jgi:hypothetical protein
MTIFDSIPKPNQMMKSGAIATFGSVCKATTHG